jgi:hypothetical protein
MHNVEINKLKRTFVIKGAFQGTQLSLFYSPRSWAATLSTRNLTGDCWTSLGDGEINRLVVVLQLVTTQQLHYTDGCVVG